MSKKELLKLPVRQWNDETQLYEKILIVPSGLEHESGYMRIAVIGVWDEGKKAEICAYPDDISYFFPYEEEYRFAKVRQDCFYPSGVLQFHTTYGKFHVSTALSSVDISLTSPITH